MKNREKIEREQGIALIFALGVLALLLIMMTAFVSSMLLQHQNSTALSRTGSVETMARSAVERAIAAMSYVMNDAWYNDAMRNQAGYQPRQVSNMRDFNRIVSMTSGGTNVSSTDGSLSDDGGTAADALAYKVNAVDIYKFDSGKGMDEPRWIYVRDDKNQAIVGRYAYTAIPNFTPKININDAWGTPTDARHGESIMDIDLLQVLLGSAGDFTGSGSGNLRTFREGFGRMVSENSNIKEQDARIYTWVGNATATDANEFYWKDINSDGMVQVDEIFRRLDLKKLTTIKNETDPTLRVDYLLNGYKTGDTKPTNIDTDDRARYFDDNGKKVGSNTDVPLTPFFKKFTGVSGEDKGTFDNADDLKKQIAANIVDFVGKKPFGDNTADVTSDIKPEEWSNTRRPAYTGNKKTYYINEIAGFLALDIEMSQHGSSVSVKMTGEFIPWGEVVNLYEDDERDYRMTVYGNVKLIGELKSNESKNVNIDHSFENTFKIFADSKDGPLKNDDGTDIEDSKGYFVGVARKKSADSRREDWGTPEELPTTEFSYQLLQGEDAMATQLKIDTLEITIESAILAPDDDPKHPVDFAKINQKFTKDDIFEVPGFTDEGYVFTIAYIGSFEVEDPRQNLNPDDWKSRASGERSDSESTGKKLLARNEVGWKSTDDYVFKHLSLGFQNHPVYVHESENSGRLDKEDKETGYVTGYSTNFIKEDKEIESLWELGAIHRGIKWQTLNLKKGSPDPAACKYDDGDAELLDMVYVSNTTNSTKFDLNARNMQSPKVSAQDNKKSWEALLAGLRISEEYENYSVGTTPALDTASVGISDFGDDGYVAGRSAFAEALSTAADAAGADTDAKQEAVFGRIANILEARNNFPTQVQLIVVAQTIEDVGGIDDDGKGVAVSISAPDADGNVQTKSDCKLGTFDEANNVVFDKITATTKMLVTLQRRIEDGGKLVVTDVEYIE